MCLGGNGQWNPTSTFWVTVSRLCRFSAKNYLHLLKTSLFIQTLLMVILTFSYLQSCKFLANHLLKAYVYPYIQNGLAFCITNIFCYVTGVSRMCIWKSPAECQNWNRKTEGIYFSESVFFSLFSSVIFCRNIDLIWVNILI